MPQSRHLDLQLLVQALELLTMFLEALEKNADDRADNHAQGRIQQGHGPHLREKTDEQSLAHLKG
jgi:hypothetical protein